MDMVRALLAELDPADARRALEALGGAKGPRPRPSAPLPNGDAGAEGEGDDPEDDDDAELDDDDGEEEGDADDDDADDDAEDDDDAAPEPPLATSRAAAPRRGKPRLVAGMFEVGPRVESCRLRTVSAMGERGEPVGYVNGQGIEQTEWPLGQMTAERLQRLTRGRGGKYLFEWLGRNAKGQRVGLGRSHEFRIQGDRDRPRKARPSGEAAAAPLAHVAPSGFEQFLAMQKYQDERRDLEEARRERANERQTELLKLKARLDSKERMQQRALEARRAKADAEAAAALAAEAEEPEPRLNEEAVRALVARKVDEELERVRPREKDAAEIPAWLRAVGIDEGLATLVKPFVQSQLPVLLSKIGGGPPVVGEPPATPYAVKKFVPRGGD